MKKLLYILPLLLFACGDPCDDITCLNDGVCIDGTCECRPGFAADDCSREVPPKSVTIESITLTAVPTTDINGNSWDSFGGDPDLFAIIRINGQIAASTGLFENGGSGTILSGGNFPFTKTADYGDDIRVEVYDYDTSTSSEFVGGYLLPDFYAVGQAFPSKRTVGSIGDRLRFEMRYTYVH